MRDSAYSTLPYRSYFIATRAPEMGKENTTSSLSRFDETALHPSSSVGGVLPIIGAIAILPLTILGMQALQQRCSTSHPTAAGLFLWRLIAGLIVIV